MKFINFNQIAFSCLSARQKRIYTEAEKYIAEKNKNLQDPATKELHIICLDYDDGVRLNIYRDLFNDMESPEFVVVKNEIYCDCAVIQYSTTRECWVLNIATDIPFKTLEDAISAATLCKGRKSRLERLQIIAETFTEYGDYIEKDINLLKSIKNETSGYGV